ncbi:MAG: hypothetical protein K2W95_00845 [Candidatus Obscuribacterales bacterium]|nr:hypothetical protein [Candidatus Obscuribacterales bacterium]
MLALAKDLWDYVLYCMDHRRPREKYVQECDQGYLCQRFVPDDLAIQLIEDGEFGESDIFDNMNLLSIRQALAVMPRNEPWLTVSSREGEADKLIQAIQDHQIFLHKRARTRRNMQRHIKQKLVRGRSAIYWEWYEDIVWRRATKREHRGAVKKFLERSGLPKEEAAQFTRGRYPHVSFAGPIVRPIDFYDIWMAPEEDLINNRRPAKIIRRFRTLASLGAERDDNDQQKYKPELLKKLQEMNLEEINGSQDHAGGREGSQRLFGNETVASQSGIKLVPIYLIYLPYFEFDHEGTKVQFWDTYFHLAINRKGDNPMLIFAEENPSDLGHNRILIDDCIDWYTPTASGGIGMVEKQLSRYHQKNFLQLLTVTQAAHSLFPAKFLLEGAFSDDEEIDFSAGALNKVQDNPYGLDVIKDAPVSESRVILGENLLRFYADDMKASSGTDGMSTDNAARTSGGGRKTATEINRDASTGSIILDNQAENDSELLTDLCQGTFEESQRMLLPDREGMLDYERYLAGKVQQGRLEWKDFQVPRSIQVQGVSGAINRQQETDNLLQGLDVATRVAPLDPTAVPLMHIALVSLWRRLNIPFPDELEKSPEELLATNPQIQQMALQAAMQNPELMAQLEQQMMGQQMPPDAMQGEPIDQASQPGGIAQQAA